MKEVLTTIDQKQNIDFDYIIEDVTKPYKQTIKVSVSVEVAEFLEADKRREASYQRQCRRKIDNTDFDDVLDFYHLPSKDSLLNLVIKREETRELQQAYNALSADEQELVTRYYYLEMSMEEIGKRLGISKMAVSKRHKKIINKMRSSMKIGLLA